MQLLRPARPESERERGAASCEPSAESRAESEISLSLSSSQAFWGRLPTSCQRTGKKEKKIRS